MKLSTTSTISLILLLSVPAFSLNLAPISNLRDPQGVLSSAAASFTAGLPTLPVGAPSSLAAKISSVLEETSSLSTWIAEATATATGTAIMTPIVGNPSVTPKPSSGFSRITDRKNATTTTSAGESRTVTAPSGSASSETQGSAAGVAEAKKGTILGFVLAAGLAVVVL